MIVSFFLRHILKMDSEGEVSSIKDLNLDDRLIRAVELLRWEKPTLIQSTAIPFVLEGKDVLARARTGSGKTAAFALPVLHKLLSEKVCPRHLKFVCHKIPHLILFSSLRSRVFELLSSHLLENYANNFSVIFVRSQNAVQRK